MSRVKASTELKQMSVLYIEDEEMIRDSFSYMLQKNVKKLYIAVNGEDGLECYKREKVDIVISDIRMPKLDGLEMSKKIKDIDETQHIMLTTAFGDIDYLKKAIEIGIDGYTIKPIDRNQLFKKLNKIAKNIIAQKKLQEFTSLITTILNEQKGSILLLDECLNTKLFNSSFQQEICKDVCPQKPVIELFKKYKKLNSNQPVSSEWFSDIEISKKTIIYKEADVGNSKNFFQIVAKKVESYILVSVTDITDIQLKNIEYKSQALVDQLTQVYNRHILDKKMKEFLNREIHMILLDIDNFKYINDTYGHPAGDTVLKTLALTLKQHLRESDLVIRWGGEEFLIILKNMKNISTLYNLAEKLRISISNLKVEKKIRFTSSFGLAGGHIKTEKEISTLIEKADSALYKAKYSGKNRVEAFRD